MMIANYHTHTVRCGHANGTEREYIEAAIANGLQVLGFSDHAPYTFGEGYANHIRMDFSELQEYVDTLQQLKKEYEKEIQIYIGLELEYFPQFFDETYEKLKTYPLDYLILAAHFHGNGHCANGEKAYVRPTNQAEYLHGYFEQLSEGMKKGCFTYLAHPDLLNYTGEVEILKAKMRKLCREANEYQLPLEINLHGSVTNKPYPNEIFWKIAGEEKCKVIVGIDAHEVSEFQYQEHYEKAMELVKKYQLHLIETVEIKGINPRF
jgi:histidinol-phosphatase (PHP family)